MRVVVLLCVWCTYSLQGIHGSTSGPGETGLGGKPRLVDGFSCCVDDWESMLCTWKLGQNLITNGSITVKLKWAIMDGLSECPHQTNTSCLWKSNDNSDTYRSGLNYYMEVVVTTGGKADEVVLEIQNFTMETNKLVKPAPVHNLTVVDRNRTCLSLRWKHNKSNRNMLYTLHVRQGYHLQVMYPGAFLSRCTVRETSKGTQIYNYTSTTNVTTCGLHPGLLYTLEVSCVPIPYNYREPHGFYSEWTSVHASTLEDVPSGVPGVEISSFRYHRCSPQTSDCEVTIYWQPVSEMECNGEITQYQVTQIDTESGQMQEFEVGASDTSVDLRVKKVREYVIKLKARTRVGYSEHNATIVIPAYQYRLPPPTNILVEAKDSVLHISWGPPQLSQDSPEGRILGYTMFYCTGSQFTYKCEDPVQWLHLPKNQTSFQWMVPGGHLDNKKIGISVEIETTSQNISSGLLWNQCVYRQKDLPPPQNVRFSRKQPDNGLQVDWDKFACADDPVYVSHYVLSYCVTNSHAECADPPLKVIVSNKDVAYLIKDLSAGVKYRVTLRAVSRTGEGPESDPISKVVKEATGFMWVVVLAVGLIVVLMMLIICVVCWKVRKVTKKGICLPVQMPELPAPQITVSNGQHECHPNAEVGDNNNYSTTRDVSVSSDTALLPHMEHQNMSFVSGSKSYMKLHRREEGSSSDASETLSSTKNKSVETYSKVDLPSVCTNAYDMSACMSNQDCPFSEQNHSLLHSPEQEGQLMFMFFSSPFSFDVSKTQSPKLHPQPPKPHPQSPTPKAQSLSHPTPSPTSHSQPPTPCIQPSTSNTQSPTPPTPHAQLSTQSPIPKTQPPTPHSQSPTHPTQSHAPNSFTTDPMSLAHLPTCPSELSQTHPTVGTAHLLNSFALPPLSQAPDNLITHKMPNPVPPFTSTTQSQALPPVATCLPPSLPPATPLPSCTPFQPPCAGYVSHEEVLNLCQTKNHYE